MDDSEVFERRVGTRLRNKWTLERLLGVGGMAAVYVAVHDIGRREAIKILHPEIAASEDMRARFTREAEAVNSFRHPGAVEIRDIDTTDDGAPFLVMELLEGRSLSDLAEEEGGLPPAEVLRLTDELLDVLAAAHAVGIVHRDIKPDNLFVLTGGRLKVLDFGIARVRAGAPTKALRTRTGATLGTLSYMPPEQVLGRPDIDGRVDIFAAGATMFRLLARRRIHPSDSEVELMMKMATQPAPQLASVAPGVAPEIALIVDRALAFDRDRRYPTALAMQGDVRAVLRGEPPAFAVRALAEQGPPAASLRGAAAGGSASPGSELPTSVVAPRAGEIPTAVTHPHAALPHPPEAPTRAPPSRLEPAPTSVLPPVQTRAPSVPTPSVEPLASPPRAPPPLAPSAAATASSPEATWTSARGRGGRLPLLLVVGGGALLLLITSGLWCGFRAVNGESAGTSGASVEPDPNHPRDTPGGLPATQPPTSPPPITATPPTGGAKSKHGKRKKDDD